jgi:drug/metabolite transporter (DMT)-like permease
MTDASIPRRGLILLTVASIGWGCSTTLSAFALRQISPTDLLAIELVSGGVVIWTVALASARGEFATPDWRTFAVLGLFEPGLTYLLANEGLRRDSAATASLLFALEAVIIVPLAIIFLAERVSSAVFLAIGVGFLGALIIAGGAQTGNDTPFGHILIFGSILAATAYALLARRSTYRASALIVTTYQLLAATAIALPFAVLSHVVGRGGLPHADASHWAAAFAAGMAGVAPFLLYNRAIVEVRATIAAGVLNLVPLVGFTTAVIFLGDRPTHLEILGGFLILLSAAWLGRSEARANFPPRTYPSRHRSTEGRSTD